MYTWYNILLLTFFYLLSWLHGTSHEQELPTGTAPLSVCCLISFSFFCFPTHFLSRPQEIDEAARRRLVKRLYIPLPDCPARKQLITTLSRQQPFSLTEQELDSVCDQTEGTHFCACGACKALLITWNTSCNLLHITCLCETTVPLHVCLS